MKITGEITGSKEVNVRLINMADRIRAEILIEMGRVTEKVMLHSQRDYLSGQAIASRSGKLRNSLVNYVLEQSEGTITGVVASRGVPYARIQHDGGQTRPHVIYPKTARVLHFFGRHDGAELFIAKVNHPGSRMKGRFYLTRPLFDLRDQIVNDLFAAAMRGASK